MIDPVCVLCGKPIEPAYLPGELCEDCYVDAHPSMPSTNSGTLKYRYVFDTGKLSEYINE